MSDWLPDWFELVVATARAIHPCVLMSFREYHPDAKFRSSRGGESEQAVLSLRFLKEANECHIYVPLMS